MYDELPARLGLCFPLNDICRLGLMHICCADDACMCRVRYGLELSGPVGC